VVEALVHPPFYSFIYSFILYHHITSVCGLPRGAQGAGLARSLKRDGVLQLLLNPSIHGIFTVKFGNVFAAVCFLQGLGYQRFLLDLLDPAFLVAIGARIVKRQHQ
jgi:hypothetical protein